MPTPHFIASLRAKVGHELLLIPTVAAIARDDRGRLLMVQDNETGLWGFPGGIIDPGETPADATVRETWEEAGVRVELTRLFGVFGGDGCTRTYANGDEIAWVCTVFDARIVGGSLTADGAETRDVRLVDDDELKRLAIHPHTQMFLDTFDAAASGPYFIPSTWKPE